MPHPWRLPSNGGELTVAAAGDLVEIDRTMIERWLADPLHAPDVVALYERTGGERYAVTSGRPARVVRSAVVPRLAQAAATSTIVALRRVRHVPSPVAPPEADAAAAGRRPPSSPRTERERVLEGVVKASGPLKRWPFRLRSGGEYVEPDTLGQIRTQNRFDDGHWFTDDAGAYRFENVPDDRYEVEVVQLGGRLVAGDDRIPEEAWESGHRAAPPEPVDLVHDEEPDMPSLVDDPESAIP